MAHHSSRSVYDRLTERLNRFPQGAPPAESLFEILKVLFSEREAALVSTLPIRPFTASRAAAIWKVPEAEARRTLEELASRALLVDWEGDQGTEYVLPPPMAGFFEFSMMRVRSDLDQKALAELFHQYLNVEEDFVRALFAGGETQLGRAFVQEAVLSPDDALHVLDFERASEVVRTATHRGISLCYCRHKMEHVGKSCDAPQDVCMTFNASASSLIRHGGFVRPCRLVTRRRTIPRTGPLTKPETQKSTSSVDIAPRCSKAHTSVHRPGWARPTSPGNFQRVASHEPQHRGFGSLPTP